MRDRLRLFLQLLWKPIAAIARHLTLRAIGDWLMTWAGVLSIVAVTGMASVAGYLVALMNSRLPAVIQRGVFSAMPAVIEDIADLPDGSVVSRYGAPRRNPTGGPDNYVIQFALRPFGPGDAPVPIRWTLEGCGSRIVVSGFTSPQLEILSPPGGLPDNCRIRLRYGGAEYGPWAAR